METVFQPAITFVIAIGPASTAALTASGVARSFRAAFGAALDCAPEVVFVAAVRDSQTGRVTLFASDSSPNVEGNTQVSADVQDALLLGNSASTSSPSATPPSASALARQLQNALSDAATIFPQPASNVSGVVVAFVALAPVAKGSDPNAGAKNMAVKMRGLLSDSASLSSALAPGLVPLAAAQSLPVTAMRAEPAPGNLTVAVTQVARVRIVYSFASYFQSLNSFLANAMTIGVSVGVSVFILFIIAGIFFLRKLTRTAKVSPDADAHVDGAVAVAPAEPAVCVTVSEQNASSDSDTAVLRPTASTQLARPRIIVPLGARHEVEKKGAARADTAEGDRAWHVEDPDAASAVTNEDDNGARERVDGSAADDVAHSRRRRAAQIAQRKQARDARLSPLPGAFNEDSDEALVTRAEANAADARQLAEGARARYPSGSRAVLSGAPLGPRPTINASAALRGAGARALLSERRGAPGLNLK